MGKKYHSALASGRLSLQCRRLAPFGPRTMSILRALSAVNQTYRGQPISVANDPDVGNWIPSAARSNINSRSAPRRGDRRDVSLLASFQTFVAISLHTYLFGSSLSVKRPTNDV